MLFVLCEVGFPGKYNQFQNPEVTLKRSAQSQNNIKDQLKYDQSLKMFFNLSA